MRWQWCNIASLLHTLITCPIFWTWSNLEQTCLLEHILMRPHSELSHIIRETYSIMILIHCISKNCNIIWLFFWKCKMNTYAAGSRSWPLKPSILHSSTQNFRLFHNISTYQSQHYTFLRHVTISTNQIFLQVYNKENIS